MKVCLTCGHRFVTNAWQCPRCGYCPEVHNGHPAFSLGSDATSGGFRQEQFAQLAALESGSFWFRSRNRLLIWALRRYFPRARSLLEIGCGTGFVLSGVADACPHLALMGSELVGDGLTFAKKRLPGVTLLEMDARRIPFADEFDVIGAFDVLEHIEEDEVVLAQMHQATRSGGGIMISVPQHRFLWSAIDDYSFHRRRYSRAELVAKIERAGFEVLRVTSFVSFLLPLMLSSRMRQRGSVDSIDPLREQEIGALPNMVFEKVLGIERALIRGGFSLPVGGSLLAVAGRD